MKRMLGALVLLGTVAAGCKSYDTPARNERADQVAPPATTTSGISSPETVGPASDTASVASSDQNGMTDENVAAESAAPVDSADQGVGGSGMAGRTEPTLNSSDNVDYQNDLGIGGSGKGAHAKDGGTGHAHDAGM